MLSKVIKICVLALLLAGTCNAVAQIESKFPSRPIRWIIPFAPGSTDILARIIGQKASESLGQPLVIESRPGAGGMIGTEVVAKATPDGYTILMGTIATHGINPALYKSMPYDAVKDFTPVCLLAFVPNVVIINPKLGLHSINEFISYAKKNPGVTFSSPGVGTSSHMAGELFQSMAGVKLTHVPYKGTSEAVFAVVQGDVQAMFSNLPPAMSLIKDGQVRALAVTSPTRITLLPELPTVSEEGLLGYDVSAWFGVFAPAGTPEKIVNRLANDLISAAADPAVKDNLTQEGYVLHTLGPAEFDVFVRGEVTKWGKVVKESGVKVE
jgi:tripartite-type tricarboxylate transporter receptor subunit TctC